MNESLLHFIWKFRLFNQSGLITTEGEEIQLIHPGTHNTDAGADFQNAKIKIGNTLWAGNIEIHINSDDWFLHRHQTDAAYNNVVLHVVFEKGKKIAVRNNGTSIPTLELKELINPNTVYRYEVLAKQKTWIPCEKFFKTVDEFTVSNLLERLLIERLENKVSLINDMLKESENDWENVLFQMIAKYFGAGINKQPFLSLAKSLPVKIWAKHQSDALQIEALVFGQAGFLEEKSEDEYPNQLRKEYQYLKRLHHLQPLEKQQWKFLRLRPSNFPTIRLAQLAALMNKEVKLLSAIKNTKEIQSLHQFMDVTISPYWETHYLFDKKSKEAKSHIGSSMKNTLLINAVAPVLFAYGKYKDDDSYCERAVQLLENCKPETNSIITAWKNLGQKPTNAATTQSLLQLKNVYCNKFGCLNCSIGVKILQ